MLQVDNDMFAQIIRDAVDVYDCDIINISAGLILSSLSGNTRTSDGTSYSSAKVTAYAARLIMQAKKQPTPEELRKMLLEQAKEIESGERYIPVS